MPRACAVFDSWPPTYYERLLVMKQNLFKLWIEYFRSLPLRRLQRLIPLFLVVCIATASVAASAEPNSADEVLLFTTVKQCAEFTDADLDLWKSRGVDGFICNITWLRPFGGTQNYTGDPTANLSAADYDTQRQLRDNNIVAR